ncbi:MAG TPA: ABC transporter substrate-binding protein, partial [Candidatus Dormibacteraeota bacterium]|nr:ABC transporter substrate-binding protein [Candidatus Dormibacteraeota bacterium]
MPELMPSRRRRATMSVLMAGSSLALTLAACGSSDNSTSGNSSSSTASAASCDSAGVTASAITVGVLMPLSGAGVTQRAGWNDGVNAYFDQLNAAGGINHRTVNVVVDDDKSTA